MPEKIRTVDDLRRQVIEVLEPLISNLESSTNTCLLTDEYDNYTRSESDLNELVWVAETTMKILRGYVGTIRHDLRRE